MRGLLVMVVISLGKLVEAVVQDTVADHLLALDRKMVQGDEQVDKHVAHLHRQDREVAAYNPVQHARIKLL